MTEQPRRNNGQFANKIGHAPEQAPALPSKPNAWNDVAKSYNQYSQIEAEQNATLSEGLSEVQNSIDAIIDIYKERQKRTQEYLDSSGKALEDIKVKLDELAARNKEIEEKLRQRKEQRKPSNIIKRIFNIKE